MLKDTKKIKKIREKIAKAWEEVLKSKKPVTVLKTFGEIKNIVQFKLPSGKMAVRFQTNNGNNYILLKSSYNEIKI